MDPCDFLFTKEEYQYMYNNIDKKDNDPRKSALNSSDLKNKIAKYYMTLVKCQEENISSQKK